MWSYYSCSPTTPPYVPRERRPEEWQPAGEQGLRVKCRLRAVLCNSRSYSWEELPRQSINCQATAEGRRMPCASPDGYN
ncbi:hypothetical protein GCM10010298_17370 [Streptomyces microflavus]|nr:hypothetical protein GCM10010298_17370 [Streptomyces microflavus]